MSRRTRMKIINERKEAPESTPEPENDLAPQDDVVELSEAQWALYESGLAKANAGKKLNKRELAVEALLGGYSE